MNIEQRTIQCTQGSQEWLQARAGIITASMFEVAREKVGCLTDQQKAYADAIRAGLDEKAAMLAAGYKAAPKSDAVARAIAGEKVGDYSEKAKNYAFRLAVERISGQPLDEGFMPWQAARGHELEPEARMEHEAHTGLLVMPAGFVLSECGHFGASADGLIGGAGCGGGAEYKCFLAPEKLRAFHIDDDHSVVDAQAQGCMWITGRDWWHVCLYCPALAPVGRQLWMKEVKRDDAYIRQLEQDMQEFKMLVDQVAVSCKGFLDSCLLDT